MYFVLKKIKDAQLRLKTSKCRWFCRKDKILGHIISEGQIAMDESKVDAIKNHEPFRNVKHIQQFLGMWNYYRRFVKDYAKIASPITELLKDRMGGETTSGIRIAKESSGVVSQITSTQLHRTIYYIYRRIRVRPRSHPFTKR